MMDYVASLENRVENLNLYLNFVQENLPHVRGYRHS